MRKTIAVALAVVAVTSAAASARPAPVDASSAASHSEARVHFSPADFAAHERRLNALIANAETRDTTGETQARAEHGYAERMHCATRACIERSYADEEAWLRHWEGAGDVR
ncbi:hypothetical protein [Phenylobacterium sp.]|jgi:hypothetical protein|uniref:hypothetical protein n=1 Tax=Phenylobacterium sp. TaxID=1871053 RepID=UPI002F41B0C6